MKNAILKSLSQILLYTSSDSKQKFEVKPENETVWLTQKMMAELFEVEIPTINKHLGNIFESRELDSSSVISILETTAKDGKKYKKRNYEKHN